MVGRNGEKQNSKLGIAIVDSPLQLINTLNMMETTSYGKLAWDLLMLEEPAFGQILYKRISSLGIFRKVFFVRNAWEKLRNLHNNRIKWATIYLNRNNIYKVWPDLSCDFSEYEYMSFCPAADFFTCNFAFLHNRNIKFIWLEDGMSSYANYASFIEKGTLKDFCRTLLRHNSGKKNIICQYLYRPELASYSVPFKREKACFLNSNSETARLADIIFEFDSNDVINEKYIYFDNVFEKDGIKTNDKEILEIVSKIVGKENMIVKVHPRNDSSIYKGTEYKICKKNDIPWEIYFFHKEMLENKILIGAISTALLSPFLYFDSKQQIISMVEMLEMGEMNSSFKTFLMSIKNNIIEQHKNIFFVPRNINELIEILKDTNYE